MDYYDLYNKVLEDNLENEISIFDGNHCTSMKSSFTIVRSELNDINDKFEFSILSINGDEVKFKGNFNNLNITLEEKQDIDSISSVFYLKNNGIKGIKEIYCDKNRNNSYAIINPIKFGVYKIEFLNLANEASEYIEMVSDEQLKICDIFYGDKKQLIGKLIRNNKYGTFEVNLASGIDYVFMLGLSSFFFCKDIYNNKDYNKCSYDNVAKVTMPSIPITNTNEKLKDKSNNKDKDNRNKNSEEENLDKTICGVIASILCCLWCCDICDTCEKCECSKKCKESNCWDWCGDCLGICCEGFAECIERGCLGDCDGCNCDGCDCGDIDCGDIDCGDIDCGDCDCGDCDLDFDD